MTSETLTIRIIERGAVQVKGKIDAIGAAANSATRGLFLMQRALFVIGGAGLVSNILKQLDALTNFENRLRIVTSTSRELESVQKDLFDAANRSRTAFTAAGEVYTRTALSVRGLGLEQQETLAFTESLLKATILSGASTREANAALIQLSQGLSSNRLSGDELRSVLEQLPFVADVIAKSLGITRGQLREFGSQGKLSAEAVLNAFREAKDEIDELFAGTLPTISQALTVGGNKIQEALDNLDDSSGFSTKLANSILFLANNFETIARSIIFAGKVFVFYFAAAKIGAFVSAVLAATSATSAWSLALTLLGFKAGVAGTGIALLAGALNAIKRLAVIAVLTALITKLNEVRTASQNAVAGLVGLRFTQEDFAESITNFNNDRTLENLRAVETTGNAAKESILSALEVAEASLNSFELLPEFLESQAVTDARAQVDALRDRLELIDDTLAGVKGELQATFGEGFTEDITAFAQSLGDVNDQGFKQIPLLRDLYTEYGFLATSVREALQAQNDLAAAQFQSGLTTLITNVRGITTAISSSRDETSKLNSLLSNLENANGLANQSVAALDLANFIAEAADGVGNLEGVAAAAYQQLLASSIQAAELNVQLGNASISATAVQGAVAGIAGSFAAPIESANVLLGKLSAILARLGVVARGLGALAATASGLSGIGGALSAAGSTASDAVGTIGSGLASGFATAFAEAGDVVSDVFNADSIRDAQGILSDVQQTLDDVGGGAGGGGGAAGGAGGGGTGGPLFAELLADIQAEAAALNGTAQERDLNNGLLQLENQLKRSLAATERELATAALENLAVMKEASSVLDEIRGPTEDYRLRQEAINLLLEQGAINAEEYSDAMLQAAASAGVLSNTFSGGLAAGLNTIRARVTELGQGVKDLVVGAFDNASSAIVDFAVAGKVGFEDLQDAARQFFQDFFAQMLKLVTDQLFAQLLNLVLPGAGALGGGGGVLGSLLGFAEGGSILPSGAGTTDTQVVSFKKRPDERVDILTPEQQRTQAANMQGASSSSGSAPTNVNVAVVMSEEDILNAFRGSEGETIIIRGIQKNAATIRKVVG